MKYLIILVAFTTNAPDERSRMGMGPFPTLEACEQYIENNSEQLLANLASRRGVTIEIEGCKAVPTDPS